MKRYPYESENFIGNRLRELRLKYGFTQEDIAKALSVSRSTYSYYELGTTRPDPGTLGMLASYYNVPIDVFYTAEIPIQIVLQDPNGRRRRTTRLGSTNPEKVGDLLPTERSLILLLRSNGVINAAQMLDYLEAHLPPQDPPPSDDEPEE